MKCDHLSKVKVNVIMSACKEYPKTIMLLEKLSKAEDGPATLISTEGCIDMISRTVTESNNSAQSALSILMRCIRSRDSATATKRYQYFINCAEITWVISCSQPNSCEGCPTDSNPFTYMLRCCWFESWL